MRQNNTFANFISRPPRHRTAAIPGTTTQVPNYPRKLKIYLNNASPYWQASYFDNGTTYRHSCKTSDKMEAFKRAGIFYEMLILRKYQHPAHIRKQQHRTLAHQQQAEHARLSFQHVAEEWLSRKKTRWCARHAQEVTRRLRNNVYPFIGEKTIANIKSRAILALLQKMEARGACHLAHRVLSDCSQIWQFAIAYGLCKRDVTAGLLSVLQPGTSRHQHTVSSAELPALMHQIIHNKKAGTVTARNALLMVAMTFVRKNELLLARWEEFDLEKACWKIPAARMKMRVEHTVPLSRQALTILRHLRQHGVSGYVFQHGDAAAALPGNALLDILYRLGYKGKMTTHGFRAVASTILNEHGFRPDVIERQLAHAEPNQVRRAYNRAQYLAERSAMMQWWSDYLEKIVAKTLEHQTASPTILLAASGT